MSIPPKDSNVTVLSASLNLSFEVPTNDNIAAMAAASGGVLFSGIFQSFVTGAIVISNAPSVNSYISAPFFKSAYCSSLKERVVPLSAREIFFPSEKNLLITSTASAATFA